MIKKTPVEFHHLDFAGFAERANDKSLSKYEKIGFPDSYRAGYEGAIFADFQSKLPRLLDRELEILDIGPGCSDLPHMLIDLCRSQGHRIHLIDSQQMLEQLPDADFIVKRPGLFPRDRDTASDLVGKIDVMICYSVLQYVFIDANPFDFIDLAIELLAPGGGEFLIGDIPNASKRRRFFASEAGIAFHRAFTQTDTSPDVQFNTPLPGMIDDAVVLALLARARAAGVDAYLLPQPPSLPMSNRREDLLLRKP
jgi:hypothetical protein